MSLYTMSGQIIPMTGEAIRDLGHISQVTYDGPQPGECGHDDCCVYEPYKLFHGKGCRSFGLHKISTWQRLLLFSVMLGLFCVVLYQTFVAPLNAMQQNLKGPSTIVPVSDTHPGAPSTSPALPPGTAAPIDDEWNIIEQMAQPNHPDLSKILKNFAHATPAGSSVVTTPTTLPEQLAQAGLTFTKPQAPATPPAVANTTPTTPLETYTPEVKYTPRPPWIKSVVGIAILIGVTAFLLAVAGITIAIVRPNQVQQNVKGITPLNGMGDPPSNIGVPGEYYNDFSTGAQWYYFGPISSFGFTTGSESTGWQKWNAGSVLGGDAVGTTEDMRIITVGNVSVSQIESVVTNLQNLTLPDSAVVNQVAAFGSTDGKTLITTSVLFAPDGAVSGVYTLDATGVGSYIAVNGVPRGDLFAPTASVPLPGYLPIFGATATQLEASTVAITSSGAIENATGLSVAGTVSVIGDILLNNQSIAGILANGSVYGPPAGSQDRNFAVFSGTMGTQLAAGPGKLSLSGDATGWNSLSVTSYLAINGLFVPSSQSTSSVANAMTFFSDTAAKIISSGTATLSATGDMQVSTLLVNNLPAVTPTTLATTARAVPVWSSSSGHLLADSSMLISSNGTVTGVSYLYVTSEIYLGSVALSSLEMNKTVSGPAVATPNAIATYSDATGRILLNTNSQLTTGGDLTVNSVNVAGAATISAAGVAHFSSAFVNNLKAVTSTALTSTQHAVPVWSTTNADLLVDSPLLISSNGTAVGLSVLYVSSEIYLGNVALSTFELNRTVSGPATATPNAIPTFADSTGRILLNTATQLTAGGALTVNSLSVNGAGTVSAAGAAVFTSVTIGSLSAITSNSATSTPRAVPVWNNGVASQVVDSPMLISSNGTSTGLSVLYVSSEIYLGSVALSSLELNRTVSGPAVATTNAIPAFSDPTGRILLNTNTQLTSGGDLTVHTLSVNGAGSVSATGAAVFTSVTIGTFSAITSNSLTSTARAVPVWNNGVASQVVDSPMLISSNGTSTGLSVLYVSSEIYLGSVAISSLELNRTVSGPAVATANAIPVFSDATGRILLNTATQLTTGGALTINSLSVNGAASVSSAGAAVFSSVTIGTFAAITSNSLTSTARAVPVWNNGVASQVVDSPMLISSNGTSTGLSVLYVSSEIYLGSVALSSLELNRTVSGPAVATANAIPVFSDTTGRILLNTATQLTTGGDLTVNSITATNGVSTNSITTTTASTDLSLNPTGSNINLNSKNLINGAAITATTISGTVLSASTSANIKTSANNAGTVLQIGSLVASGVPSTTPNAIDLGSGYSTAAGSNLKFKIYNEPGGVTFGFGASPAQLDYVTISTTAAHVFYANGAERFRISPSLISTTLALNVNSLNVNSAATISSAGAGVFTSVTIGTFSAITSNSLTSTARAVPVWNNGVASQVVDSPMLISSNGTSTGLSVLYVSSEIYLGSVALSSLEINRTVSGPAVATANAIPVFSDTTGRILLNTATQLTTGGDLTVNSVTATNGVLTNSITSATASTDLSLNPTGSNINLNSKNLISGAAITGTTITGTVLSASTSVNIRSAANNAGTVLQLGSVSSGVASASPNGIDLGCGFSSAAGNALKIKVYNDAGGTQFGFGVSASKLDYVVTGSTSAHVWYVGGTERFRITSSALQTAVAITTASGDLSVNPAGSNVDFNSKSLKNVGTIIGYVVVTGDPVSTSNPSLVQATDQSKSSAALNTLAGTQTGAAMLAFNGIYSSTSTTFIRQDTGRRMWMLLTPLASSGNDQVLLQSYDGTTTRTHLTVDATTNVVQLSSGFSASSGTVTSLTTTTLTATTLSVNGVNSYASLVYYLSDAVAGAGKTAPAIPSSVKYLLVTIIGGGAGSTSPGTTGAGAGSCLYTYPVPYVPGTTITYTVGAGGTTAPSAGGSSSVTIGSRTATAAGGSPNSGSVGGAGGTITGFDGTTAAGGSGGSGTGVNGGNGVSVFPYMFGGAGGAGAGASGGVTGYVSATAAYAPSCLGYNQAGMGGLNGAGSNGLVEIRGYA